MSENLDELAKIATARIGVNSSLEEIEKAVGIAKTVADTGQITTEFQNRRAQYNLEWFKALPSLAVPIVSLLTLFGTVWIQGLQLQESRQQDVDKQWREFLSGVRESVKGSSSQTISDPTFAPRLKSFLNSPVYKSQVVDLAKRMMGSIANKSAFDDLFTLVFPDQNSIDIADLADISKSVARSMTSLLSLCQSLSSGITLPATTSALLCDYVATSETDLPRYLSGLDEKRSANVVQARRDLGAIASEQSEVSQVLASRLRQQSSDQTLASRTVDIGGSYIIFANLSGVDFRHIDVSNTTFDTVKLTGATFVPLKGTPSWMAGTNWWDAKEIEPQLLDSLIKTSFPGYINSEAVVGDKPLTRDDYTNRISELCKVAKKNCEASTLQFNEQNFRMTAPPP